jgi:hypothetical protein
MPGVQRCLAMCFGALHMLFHTDGTCAVIFPSASTDMDECAPSERRYGREAPLSLTSSRKSFSTSTFRLCHGIARPKNGAVSPPSAAAESTPSPQSLTQLTAMSLRVPLLDAASHVVAPDLVPAPLPPPPLPPPLPLQHESFEIVEAGDERSRLPSDRCPINLKQTDLAVACKRICVPSGGKKVELVNRLAEKGATTTAQIEELILLYHEEGREDVPVVSRALNREPKWTGGESIRLISILSDPRHATSLHFLYNKPDDRSGLDVPRVDPFAEAFRLQFNDENYEPEAPDAALGITQDLLDELAEKASTHPHERNGTVLKSRWLKIRTTFTTAWHAYTKSGQQDGDNFESFVRPEKASQEAQATMYCAAAFYGQPSLNEVAQVIPGKSAVEEGVIGCVTVRDRAEIAYADANANEGIASRWKRVRHGESASDMSAALRPLTAALSQPIQIRMPSSPKRTNTRDKGERTAAFGMERNALARDFASTMTKLMDLETAIESQLQVVMQSGGDEEKVTRLKTRLYLVQDQIEQAARPISTADDGTKDEDDDEA